MVRTGTTTVIEARGLRTGIRRALALAALACALLAGPATGHAATLSIIFDDTSSGAGTGQAPFDGDDSPGHDSSPANHLVRSSDQITYHWSISANATSANTTVTQTLPSGYYWNSLPSYCLASGSSVTTETLVCNLGAVGSASVDVYPIADSWGGGGRLRNGETLTTHIDVVSDNAPQVSSPDVTDTVSAAPQWDLAMFGSRQVNGTLQGVTGVYSTFNIAVGFSGQSIIGSEAIPGDFSFTDDVSGFTTDPDGLPDARLVSCAAMARQDFIYAAGATSGTPTCTQASPGAPITVAVTGADMGMTSYNGYYNPNLASNLFYPAAYVLVLFTPRADVVGRTQNVVNRVGGFDPDSVTGQSNYGTASVPLGSSSDPGGQPPEDDSVAATFDGDVAAGRPSSEFVFYRPSTYAYYDGTIVVGESVEAKVEFDNRGTTADETDLVLCDKIDRTTMALTRPLASTDFEYVDSPESTDPTGVRVEYGTQGARGADPAQWFSAGDGQRYQHCGDDDNDWRTEAQMVDDGVAWGDVTSIRVVYPLLESGTLADLYIPLTSRTTVRDGSDPVVGGTMLATFLSVGHDVGSQDEAWVDSTYDPQPSSGYGPALGDRLIVKVGSINGSVVRTDSSDWHLRNGQTVTFAESAYARRGSPFGGLTTLPDTDPVTMRNVLSVVQIPAQYKCVEGSVTPRPASTTLNPDGSLASFTVDHGDVTVPVGQTQRQTATTNYTCQVRGDVANGAYITTWDIASSDDDSSPINFRAGAMTQMNDRVVGLLVAEIAMTPLVGTDDLLVYDVTYGNLTTNALPDLDVISVLPWNGDGRSPATSFNGAVSLTGVDVSNGESVLYTDRPSADVSADPQDPSNAPGGATVWCTGADVGDGPGCPASIADATAVRIHQGNPVDSGSTFDVYLHLQPTGNELGDVYTTSASLSSSAVTQTAPSSDATSRVVGNSIGDYVFLDRDGDGTQYGEPGVGGVTVDLYAGTDTTAPPLDTTTTDTAGSYLFSGLPGGQYTVRVEAPAGYDPTTEHAGGDSTADSDVDSTGTSDPIDLPDPSLTGPVSDTAVDVGLTVRSDDSMAGHLYRDSNANGIWDATDVPVDGGSVTLDGTDIAGQHVNVHATSAGDGSYSFAGLAPGTYSLSASLVDTLSPAGAQLGTSGGVVEGANSIDQIVLPLGGASASGYDFAYAIQPGVAYGFVYDDVDGDGDGSPNCDGPGGICFPTEPVVANVTIHVTGTDSDGDPVSLTTQTTADGLYYFILHPGTYTITDESPAGYSSLYASGGSAGFPTPDADTIEITATSGALAGSFDFAKALRSSSSLSGSVFDEGDGNGIQDGGEPGLGGVTVELAGNDVNGDAVSVSTTTNPDGTYTFTGLAAGSYAVTSTPPTGYAATVSTPGSDGGDSGQGAISAIPLGGDDAATGYAFAETSTRSGVSGVVYDDVDADGSFDAGDVGLSGASVRLVGTDRYGDAVDLSTTTGSDGAYAFTSLVPGDYTVTDESPSGYTSVSASGGSGAVPTPDADTIGGFTTDGQNDVTGLDFAKALASASSLSGTVFDDGNGDGVENGTDAGAGGLTVSLVGADADGTPIARTATTSSDGGYTFAALPTGTYRITTAVLGDHVATIATAGTDGGVGGTGISSIDSIHLGGADDATGYTFAQTFSHSSLDGTVYDDINTNALADAGEPGLEGATLSLNGTDAYGTVVVRTTTSDADGHYAFDDLVPGTYSLTAAPAAGRVAFGGTPGPAGGTATGADTIDAIALAPATAGDANDFAQIGRAELAGTVSTADGGAVPGVLVRLQGVDAFGRPVSLTVTTDAAGRYVFAGLLGGSYTLDFTAPAGYAATSASAGTLGGAVVTGARIGLLHLLSGSRASGYDFRVARDPTAPPVGKAASSTPPPVTAPAASPPVPAGTAPSPARLTIGARALARSVLPDHAVTWRIRVRNTGATAAANVRLCLSIPRTQTYVSASRKPRFLRGRPCWTIALGAHGDVTIRVVTRVGHRVSPGRIATTSTVSAAGTATRTARAHVRVRAVARTVETVTPTGRPLPRD